MLSFGHLDWVPDTFGLAWRLGFCGIRPDEIAERAQVPPTEVDTLRELGECSELTFGRIAAVLEMALEEEERWRLRSASPKAIGCSAF